MPNIKLISISLVMFSLGELGFALAQTDTSSSSSSSEVSTEYIYELRQERKFEELEALAMKNYQDAYGDYQSRKYDQAGVKFKELVFLYPGFSKVVEASYYMGESFYNSGDYTDARDAYTRIIKNNPDSIYYPKSLFRMEQLGFKQERYTEAIFYHQEIINRYHAGTLTQAPEVNDELKIEKFIDTANYIGGICRYSIGEFKDAYDVLSQVTPDSDCYGYAQYTMALCQIQQDDTDAGIKQLQTLIGMSLKGNIEKPLKNLAHVTLARLFYEVGKYDESVQEYERVDTDDAENYDNALLGIGWVYIKQEKYDKAIGYFEKIVQRGKSSELIAEAKLSMAHCNLGMGKYDQAMDQYRDIKQNYNLELELAGDPRVSEVYRSIFEEMDKVEEIYTGFLELDKIAVDRQMEDIHQQIQSEIQEIRRLQDQLAGLEMWFSGRSTTGRNLMLGAEFGMATIAFQKEQLLEKDVEKLSVETDTKVNALEKEKTGYSVKAAEEVAVEEQHNLGVKEQVQGEAGVVSLPAPEEFGVTRDSSGNVEYNPKQYFPTEKRTAVTGPVEEVKKPEETTPSETPPTEEGSTSSSEGSTSGSGSSETSGGGNQ
jgi:TolA-binding protein